MENNKTFFDNWVETQNKMMDQWNSTLQKGMESARTNDAFQAGSDWMKQWMSHQQEMVNKFKEAGKEQTEKNKAGMNSFLDGWMENQRHLSDTFLNSLKGFSGPYMNGQSDNYFEQMRNAGKSWMEAFNTGAKNWTDAYARPAAWAEMAQKTTSDTYRAMKSGFEAYSVMARMWKPMMDKMMTGEFSGNATHQFIDPAAFKAYLDKLFNFDHGTALLQQLMGSWMKMAAEMQDSNRIFDNIDAWKNQMAAFGNPVLELANRTADGLRQMLAPFTKLAEQPKAAKVKELVEQLGKEYNNAYHALTGLQYLIYKEGAATLDAFVKSTANKYADQEGYKDFNDLYSEWLKESGAAFESLFHTDEYSRLQGEAVNAQSNIKLATNELTEIFMEPFPVLLRSQADEIYRTNHDLKRRVYELEKELKTRTAKAGDSAIADKASKNTAAANRPRKS